MTRNEQLSFEIYVMDLAERCKTKNDYERLANELHQSIENALEDMCMDNGIEDYEPSY
jgi:hypothetical protein